MIKNPPEEIITWNYLGIGAFYKSRTKTSAKPAEDKDISFPLKITTKPLVAIGGINFDNMSRVFSLGYETIALSDGIFLKNDLKKIVKYLSL